MQTLLDSVAASVMYFYISRPIFIHKRAYFAQLKINKNRALLQKKNTASL